jgi:YbbR domain-containing protein
MAYHPFRHLGLKIVALTMAMLLWLTVAGEHVVERIIRVPIEFRNIPSDLEVVGDPPDTVDVRLRGSSSLISGLNAGEVVAVLDLDKARPGSRLFHLRNEDVRSPFGVEVTQVVPATVGIELEKSARRRVPVVAQVEGDPAAGYVVGQIVAEPATVEIVGPEGRVKRIGQAITEPISVEGARHDVRDVVTVGLTDAALRLVQPQNATVIVSVVPAPVERELANVPVRARNRGRVQRVEISPPMVTVSIRGRREAVESAAADAIDAFVDLADLGAGRYNLRVQVEPSHLYGVSAIAPQVVDVTIR